MEVRPPLPRVSVAPVAVGGQLVAGLSQWLGIALAPMEGEEESQEEAKKARLITESECGQTIAGQVASSAALRSLRLHVQPKFPGVLRVGEAPPFDAAQSQGGAGVGVRGAHLHAHVHGEGGWESRGLSPLPSFSHGGGVHGGMHSQQPSMAAGGSLRMHGAAFTSSAAGYSTPVPYAELQHMASMASSVHAGQLQQHARNRLGSMQAPCRVEIIDLGQAHVHAQVQSPAASTSDQFAEPSPAGAVDSRPITSWASMSHRHTLDLTQAMGRPIAGPLLVWLPVSVAPQPTPPEVVRVQPLRRKTSMGMGVSAGVPGVGHAPQVAHGGSASARDLSLALSMAAAGHGNALMCCGGGSGRGGSQEAQMEVALEYQVSGGLVNDCVDQGLMDLSIHLSQRFNLVC